MEIELLFQIIILGIVGVFMGGINTLAGGGSLITLPLLIFMGLDGPTANGTNRLSIVTQSFFAIQGYKSKGVNTYPYNLWLGLAALAGAIPGAILAVKIDAEIFNRVLAIIMLVVITTLIYNPFKKNEPLLELISPKRLWLSIFIVFCIGLYIGFIQAGAGIMVIMTMMFIHKFSLVKANYIKIWVTLLANAMAMAIFIFKGLIHWEFALALSVGSALGGWLSSRIAIEKGDNFIRPILIIMTIIMALKLLAVF
jgi:uncharacterized membrane protein YfcA